jgi:hypothetical protein
MIIMNQQNSNKRVIVHIDNRYRDLMSATWLKFWLEQLGAEVRLTSRATLLKEFERFRPHACLLSHVFSFGNQDHEIFIKYAKRTRLFIMPTEDGIIFITPDAYPNDFEPDIELAKRQPEKGFLHYVTRVYCWGAEQKQNLLQSGVATNEQVYPVGNPRFDIDWDRLSTSSVEGKPIGIVTSFFDFINPWDFYTRPWPDMPTQPNSNNYFFRRVLDGPEYTFYAIDEWRKFASQGIFIPVNRNVEDVFWGVHANLRLIFDFLDSWTQRGGKVILRPHPLERIKSYDYLLARYSPYLEINREQGFFHFLEKVSATIVMSSTSIIEAYLAKRPIICLESLLHGRYQEHLSHSAANRLYFMDYLWRPQNMDTLIKMATAATHGQLSSCPNPALFDEILKKNYDWPRSEPTTYTIAKDVMNFLAQDDFEPEKPSSVQKLKHEVMYEGHVLARKIRSRLRPEWRQFDEVYHQLGPSSPLEQEFLSYLRRDVEKKQGNP